MERLGREARPALGLPAQVAPHRADQVDGEALARLDQDAGIDVTGIHEVLGREQILRGECLVRRRRHRAVGKGRRTGLHVSDRARPIRVAPLGQVDLVADPRSRALAREVRVEIVGRADE